jgi:hypothetical protein
MKYLNTRKGFMAGIFMAALALTITVMAQEIPKVPDFEKMLKWTPERDRSMVVTFPGVRFKFEILDWRESEACKTVAEAEHEELKWITHVGSFAHEYRTKNKPVAYQLPGDPTWRWVGKKTYEPKTD